MPKGHPNIDKIPACVERPIPTTMRNIVEWPFLWETRETGQEPKVEDVVAYMTVPWKGSLRAEIRVTWFRNEGVDHWYVGRVKTPGWSDGRSGPNTTQGLARWLTTNGVEKS